MPIEKLYTSPKEHIIKAIGEQMGLNIEEVEKVVSWSYMKANSAIKEHIEIEASGLGKFMASQAKVGRRIKCIERALQNPELSEERRRELERELTFVKTKQRIVSEQTV